MSREQHDGSGVNCGMCRRVREERTADAIAFLQREHEERLGFSAPMGFGEAARAIINRAFARGELR